MFKKIASTFTIDKGRILGTWIPSGPQQAADEWHARGYVEYDHRQGLLDGAHLRLGDQGVLTSGLLLEILHHEDFPVTPNASTNFFVGKTQHAQRYQEYRYAVPVQFSSFL